MGLMMPPRAGGVEGGERGRCARSWVGCGVGATVWALPQTAVAAVRGLGELRTSTAVCWCLVVNDGKVAE